MIIPLIRDVTFSRNLYGKYLNYQVLIKSMASNLIVKYLTINTSASGNIHSNALERYSIIGFAKGYYFYSCNVRCTDHRLWYYSILNKLYNHLHWKACVSWNLWLVLIMTLGMNLSFNLLLLRWPHLLSLILLPYRSWSAYMDQGLYFPIK